MPLMNLGYYLIAKRCSFCLKAVVLGLRDIRLPHPPEESLLLGSALAMRRPDHHRSLRAWAAKLGGVFAARIFNFHVRPFAASP